MKKNLIIGIAGEKNTGKDTVAKMIASIFIEGYIASNYRNYNMYYTNKDYHGSNVIAFGDAVKEAVSLIFGIDIKVLYDRNGKDASYYCFDDFSVRNEEYVKSNRYFIIEPIHLSDNNLNKARTNNNGKTCIKVRHILQYFGTEIGRNLLHDNVWINATINKIKKELDKQDKISKHFNYVVIPDVRFKNEADAIHKQGGIIIRLKRDTGNKDNHFSEIIDFNDFDYVIENDSTLMRLFHKVKSVIGDELTK